MDYKTQASRQTYLILSFRFWVLTLLLVALYSAILFGQTNVYIDPGNSGDPSQDGTMDHPFDSWSDFSIQSNNSYLQKRGTTAIGNFAISGKTNVVIGAYGTGERPIITGQPGSTTRILALNNGAHDCTIENINFVGDITLVNRPTAAVYFAPYSGPVYDITVRNCDISYCYNAVRGGSSNFPLSHLTFDSINTNYISEDGFFFQNTSNVTIKNSVVDGCNWDWHWDSHSLQDASGDGIQFSFDCDNIVLENVIIDRSATGNKFCFIHNGDQDVASDIIIRDCYFIPPKDTVGAVSAGGAIFLGRGDTAIIERTRFGGPRYYDGEGSHGNIGGQVSFDHIIMKYCVFDSCINFENTQHNDDFLMSNVTATGNNPGSSMIRLQWGVPTMINCALAGGTGTTPVLGTMNTISSKIYEGDISTFASEFGWTDWASGNYQLCTDATNLIDVGTITGDTMDFGCQSVPIGIQDIGAHEFCDGSGSTNNAPVINNQNFSVPENTGDGQVVGIVVASDPDAGQLLTYSIISGNTDGAFALDPTTGSLSVNTASALDFEVNPLFNLTVKVTDNGNTPLSATAAVSVNLTDVNEEPEISDQSFSVDENSSTGSSAGVVSATDPDNGQSLTFAITAGNTGDPFTINSTSGEITVNNAMLLDFETNPVFSLTVEVTDDGAGNLSGQATVTINLNDVNEVPEISDQSFSVDENSSAGSSAGVVSATDPDNGQSLTFAITAGNTGDPFTINSTSGEITVNNTVLLDFETNPVFSLTVEVTDDGAGNLSGQATVTINLNDVNEVPEISDQSFSVDENSSAGSSAGVVSATDPDNGQSLTFAITAGNTGDPFTINSTTGEITVNNAVLLDFETNPVFSLTVEVTDDGAGNLSGQATVTINLNDVNEVPEISDQSFSVDENSSAGSSAGVVSATDPDNGQSLTFAITAGNTGDPFTINSTTGEITVNNAVLLDFETNPVFSLTVEVTDDGAGNLSGQATVTINLNDVNEVPEISDQSFTVDENTSNGAILGNVVASDPDAGQVLTYAIASGNTNNAFSINGNTGELEVNNTIALNFEVNPVFYLTIEVTDNGAGTLSNSAVATVSLNDVNEAPVMSAQSFEVVVQGSVLIPDAGATHINVGYIAAYEPDINQELTFSLGGEGSDAWSVDPNSGQLILVHPQDLFISESNHHYIFANATDDSPEMLRTTAMIQVMVTIADDLEEPEGDDQITGVKSPAELSTSYSIYPNPVQDMAKIEVTDLTDHNVLITIHNLSGEMVWQEKFDGVDDRLKTSLNLAWLNKGVYILTFQHGEVSHIAKLIKQ